ncbi:MAG: hypothetical protein RMK30_09200 [Anaerolineae bacterium]|nr:hypothetical protein [Anaerolineae bacterium]MDW8103039.1 hypothetical protein [Anaerolineae bacterium]
MDLKSQLERHLRGLEKLALSIPGFKGYKEKEIRREADRLLRQHVASVLEEARGLLQETQIMVMQRGKIGLLDDLERAVMKLQNTADRLRTASYGYSGFFDAVKIREEELDALYDFDLSLLGKAEALVAAAKGLKEAAGGGEELLPLINQIISEADALMDTFLRRQEAVINFKGEG